ncbi:MAG: flavodoxin family protein [Thermodesulfovibrionales bacterium]|nr:flavodoxin family protein [Thermodesulfovibrionales bacterium]
MKVVAFYGSPRINGNSETLLNEALKPIEAEGHEIISFKLNFMNIKPCQNCGGCDKKGRCVIDDDMTDIYKAIREGDRFILASPIFFFALSAQTKIMLDRCQAFWAEKYLLKREIPAGKYGRKGLLFLVGGMKREVGINCSENSAKAFFRTISVPTHETLAYLGIDAKGDILEHPTALKEAYEAGKRLVSI